ncbi:MAG: biotin/lipoyl-containing protein, partial [Novosphingobium sp.]
RIWFMEMNTRLQVEHPVTEEITGVDLVEWQLRVASGEPIPLRQEDLSINGWAMEARLYAEDPAKGFLPSIGRLELFELGEGAGGRIDTGIYEGAEVSPFYDPMIAKVIAHGSDREQARERLHDLIVQSAIWPVRTNAAFLAQLIEQPDFVDGDVDTGLIAREGDALTADPAPSDEGLTHAAAALVSAEPMLGFRLNAPPRRTAWFLVDGAPRELAFADGDPEPQDAVLFSEAGQTWRVTPWRAESGGQHGSHDGDILSPMPGKIIAVEVCAGDTVTKGQKLLTLEAMKMEHTLTAPFDGTVAELSATPGAQVQVEALLARIEAAE